MLQHNLALPSPSQLSTNGLATFSAPYLSWWAIPFPYGFRQVPVIAPYWADIDFRNSIPGSGLYHRVYTSSDGEGSLRTMSLLNEFSRRLQQYSTVNFDPGWMAVVTWNLASTYYRKYYMDEVWVGVVTCVFLSSPNVASFSYTPCGQRRLALTNPFVMLSKQFIDCHSLIN